MKTIIILTFLCLGLILNAQNYDFGKVSKAELEEKYNPMDSSANAAYLYKYRKTFFEYLKGEGFNLITEIHERIKIYNPEGFNYATISIGLYKDRVNKEEVNGLKAYTFNLVDGNIEEVKLKKDGIFKTERSKYYNQTKFTMPNIKEGSVIEYKYRINSPFISNVDEFIFQHEIPVNKIDARIEIPEYFTFKVNTKGFLGFTPQHESKRDKITFTNKTRSGGTSLSGGGVTTGYSTNDVEYTKNITKYDLYNIPALKEEPFVNNMDNYRSAVKYELSYTKFPNSPIDYYSTTWEDVIETIYKSSNFGGELDKSGYYEDDIDALIGSVSDPMTRVSLVYKFVKSKVKWNNYYSKYTSEGVRKAYKEHVGNVAEINLMLTSMLRYAGLKANPVLVSTRSHGVPLFPTREGYNYVICGVEMPNNVILLDATSKYSTPNILPFRTLNWEGRIIREHGSSALVNLYPKEKSNNTISMMVNLDDSGNIEGGIRSVKSAHHAMSFRESYLETDRDQFLENLENEYHGIEVMDFVVKNETDLSKPVMESYKFIKESQADVIGDKIYFSPLFFLRTVENPFKLETREFPVDFGYPSRSTYRISIKLPEGYVVESIPDTVLLSLPDNLGSFKFNISSNQMGVSVIISTEINEALISPIYYETIKEYFKQIIEKENEQIVLTKA